MDQPDAASTPSPDWAATAAVPVDAPLRPATFPYRAGDMILPGYRLTKRLGSGGFGEVWRAEAPGGMGVAIKVLANLGRREGGREYRALQTIKNIRHAHIVPMFGVWLKASDGHILGPAELQAAEQRILAVGPAADSAAGGDAGAGPLESLELLVAMGLGDQTLFDRLQEAKRAGEQGLPTESLLGWMHEAALALDHFNSGARRSTENATAVQHCDIKPQNMLLVGDVVQVCDFGLARAQGEVRATSNNMASLAYAAPEMISPPYDPAPTTDQYSLAISYVELRTGKLPYAELNPMTIMRAKLDGRIDLSGLSPAEARVVGKALAVDPARRWPTCVEFIKALRASLRATGVTSGPVPAPADVFTTNQAAASSLAETKDATGGSPGARTVAARSDRDGSPPVAPASAAVSAGRGRLVAGILAGVAAALLGGLAILWPGRQPEPPPAAAGGAASSASSTAPAPAAATGTTAAPPVADRLAQARGWEKAGDFAAAGKAYAAALAGKPDDLATVLWDLQTRAADAGRVADCMPLLELLEQLYASSPAPQVKGISRWDVVNSLAWYAATRSDADSAAIGRARQLADEAILLAGRDPGERSQSLDTLAAAAARGGDWETAIASIDEAIGLTKDDAQRADFEKRRQSYAARSPWVDR
jgi:serine/threonine protein kinase